MSEPREAPPPAIVVEPSSRARRLLAWLDDRVNPILVKEVRQALHGAYFRNVFWFTVVAATLAGSASMVSAVSSDQLDQLGPQFFSVIFGCLAIAVLGFVPLWAFFTLGDEWQENTFDLLVISNLRPRQIVLGKMLAAVVLAALFYCAFGPFLVFTFLMRGVDLWSVVVALLGSMWTCGVLSLCALAFSSLARTRAVRVAMLAGLALGLMMSTGSAIAFASALVRFPARLYLSGAVSAYLLFVCATGVLGLFALAIACGRLAHEEENHSTALRVLTLVALLLPIAWGIADNSVSPSELELLIFFSALLSAVPFLFFVTEPERLGRRIRKQVPRRALLALLASPFLPGGGRGMLLLLLYGAVGMIGSLAAGWPSFTPAKIAAAIAGYLALYLGPLSGLVASRNLSPLGRAGLRITIPLLALGLFFAPALLGLFLGVTDWMAFRHFGNPFQIGVDLETGNGERAARYLAILLALALVSVLINLRRMLRGVREVLAESAAQRAAHAAAPLAERASAEAAGVGTEA